MATHSTLIKRAQDVLTVNDHGTHIVPSRQLYPHQWLWDSCFIALGLATYNPPRAAQEILSLLEGQWQNGMLPNIVFRTDVPSYWLGPQFWRSEISPYAPNFPRTSGITQPPLPAVATLRVADSLPPQEADAFLSQAFPKLLAYHRWLYAERDPKKRGLITLIHPWESGMDNSPPWMHAMRLVRYPLSVMLVSWFGLRYLFYFARSDRKFVSLKERISTLEGARLFALNRYYQKRAYNNQVILQKPRLAIEDVTFNSILIAANQSLVAMAKRLETEIPKDLLEHFKSTTRSLEKLWDSKTGQYYHRHYKTEKLIKIPSITTFLPLYSASITKERAAQLVKLLTNSKLFWPLNPVPTAPLTSGYFNPIRYWQGPTWVNTNWLIIQGLRNYGYHKEANQLKHKTIKMVEQSGFYEYFSPFDGSGHGINNFSWTAALILDLLNEK